MTFDPANPKPGRYDDLPIEVYHKGPGISRSALKHLEDGTPRDLQHYLEWGVEESDAMRLGIAVDMLVFEPDLAREQVAVRPPFGRKKADLEARAEWDDAHEGKLILTEAQGAEAHAIAAAVHRAPSIRALLRGIEPQPSYFFDRDGVLVKARPDAIANGYSFDLKTTRSMAERHRWTAMVDLAYDAQLAMVREGMLAAGDEWKAGVIVWASKAPPYDVHLQLIEEGDAILELGEKRYERWLHTYRECLATGRWPDRSSQISKMKTPIWIAKKLEEEIELENKRATSSRESAA